MQARIPTSSKTALVIALLFTSCDQHQPIARQQLQRVRVSQFHMGMMVHLTMWSPTVKQGRQAAAVAFQRIGQIDQIMSDYEPDSELSRLCRRSGQGPVPVSPELFTVISAAWHFAELTDGRYDPTVGPLTKLWRQARSAKVLPSQVEIDAALEQVGYRKLLLDTNAKTVELTHPDMWLDLGSIAKGYAGDEAIAILREMGISRAAYEAGGDKVFGVAPPGERGWQVITDLVIPELPPLANCAVSISGDSEQLFEVGGKRFGHVIDPRTGLGFFPRAICIVTTPRGIESDPLATIVSVLPSTSYKVLLKDHFPQAHATVVASLENDVQDNDSSKRPQVPPP